MTLLSQLTRAHPQPEAPAPHHPLEMAICMGMDAMRLCLGMPTRNYTRDEIEAWMDAMAETETKP
jgi:hypothetical protein